jgi:hypothetical protein
MLGVNDHAADARQVSGEGVPELGYTAVIGVRQPAVRQVAQGTQQSRLPRGAREGVEVGLPGP